MASPQERQREGKGGFGDEAESEWPVTPWGRQRMRKEDRAIAVANRAKLLTLAHPAAQKSRPKRVSRGSGMFKPGAKLDASQIDDRRGQKKRLWATRFSKPDPSQRLAGKKRAGAPVPPPAKRPKGSDRPAVKMLDIPRPGSKQSTGRPGMPKSLPKPGDARRYRRGSSS